MLHTICLSILLLTLTRPGEQVHSEGLSAGPEPPSSRFILLSVPQSIPRGVIHPQEIWLGKRIFTVPEGDATPLNREIQDLKLHLMHYGRGVQVPGRSICWGAEPEKDQRDPVSNHGMLARVSSAWIKAACLTLIDLRILKNPCIPEIKPTWSWCMIFLMCCWILIARILLILERVVSTAFSSSCLHLKNHSFVYCSNCSVKISHVTYNQLVDRSSGFDSSSDSSTPLSIW